MCSRQILFANSSPYIIDTSNCNSQPYSAFFQSAGDGTQKNKKVTSIDITKQFMFILLTLTVVDSKIPKDVALNNCFNDLKPFISKDFMYNNKYGNEGLKLLCHHMKDLKNAFPSMNLTVTHFKDIDKNSVVIILMVLGVMKGPWLNAPATHKYERLGSKI